jgi:hypothetical protein
VVCPGLGYEPIGANLHKYSPKGSD